MEEQSQQTEKQLPNIQTLVEDKKSAADILEEFTHPCGGSGWKLAVYRDFRDPDTPCPPEWQQTLYSERPYTCGRPISGFPGCGTVTFSETGNLEYSKVCGRIKAYQFGTALELFSSYIYVNLNLGAIWTFSAGITQSQVDPSLQLNRCPCDGGPDMFGEYYFCESLIEEDNPGTKYSLLPQ